MSKGFYVSYPFLSIYILCPDIYEHSMNEFLIHSYVHNESIFMLRDFFLRPTNDYFGGSTIIIPLEMNLIAVALKYKMHEFCSKNTLLLQQFWKEEAMETCTRTLRQCTALSLSQQTFLCIQLCPSLDCFPKMDSQFRVKSYEYFQVALERGCI